MTVSQLDAVLDSAVCNFSDRINALYKEGSHEPVSEHDIYELARQTGYTLDEFRKAIVKYLEER